MGTGMEQAGVIARWQTPQRSRHKVVLRLDVSACKRRPHWGWCAAEGGDSTVSAVSSVEATFSNRQRSGPKRKLPLAVGPIVSDGLSLNGGTLIVCPVSVMNSWMRQVCARPSLRRIDTGNTQSQTELQLASVAIESHVGLDTNLS